MKIRQSGMPERELWEGLFNVPLILDRMSINESISELAEFGSGYGTFTFQVAKRIKKRIHAFDVDPEMVLGIRQRIAAQEISVQDKIAIHQRDFVEHGSGLADNSIDYVMMFNILHHDDNQLLLAEAIRVLTIGGLIGIIHWRSDIPTPRGPSLDIRPQPDSIRQQLAAMHLRTDREIIDLAPYHFGMLAIKTR